MKDEGEGRGRRRSDKKEGERRGKKEEDEGGGCSKRAKSKEERCVRTRKRKRQLRREEENKDRVILNRGRSACDVWRRKETNRKKQEDKIGNRRERNIWIVIKDIRLAEGRSSRERKRGIVDNRGEIMRKREKSKKYMIITIT